MGYDLYRIEYVDAKIPRDYDFQEWLLDNFSKDTGNLYIELGELNSEVAKLPKNKLRMWKLEIARLRSNLKKMEYQEADYAIV